MKTIQLNVIAALLVTLFSHLSYANAEETDAQSRADKIKSFTQKNRARETSIKQKTTDFIADLKEKYPQLSQENLESMAHTFEESLLDKQTPQYSKQKQQSKSEEVASHTTVSKEALHKEVKQLVDENAEKNQHIASQAEVKEAKITIVSLIVREGDTLSDIARRTYGDPNMYLAIYEENRDQLDSPNKVPTGVTLRVPKIDNSMKKKFKQLLRKAENKTKKPKVTKIHTAKSKDLSHLTPSELNKLISEAVSASVQ